MQELFLEMEEKVTEPSQSSSVFSFWFGDGLGRQLGILYIKATVVVSICVGSAWKIPITAHSCGDKQGRAAAAGGGARCHFY